MRRFAGYGVIGVIVLSTLGTSIAVASSPITGKVRGRFHRDCLFCDARLKSYIKTSSVWCAWQRGKVLVHVTMRNTSVEHLTVDWHPSYVIARGGEHGTGIGSVQSNGFDAGQLRQLFAKQDPKGVPDGSRISVCKPSFYDIESG